MRRFLAVCLGLAIGASPALPCSICDVNFGNTPSMRQEVGQAKMVLFGTLENPRPNPANPAGGSTDLAIDRILKDDPFRAGRKKIELPRLVPLDPKNPPKFLVFCDIFNGKLDPYRGIPVKSPAIVEYIRGAMELPADNRVQELLYFARYLEHADADIARDAFLEFAKASDQDVGQASAKMAPKKIKAWMEDPQTPSERLNLYAFMLGACGGDEEARLLATMVQKPTERTVASLGGILAGYIQLRPAEGWDLCFTICRDRDRPLLERLGAVRTLRFYHGMDAQASRRHVLRCLDSLVETDLADLAFEDLRKWKYWDLTPKILAQWGKDTHKSPIVQRALVRYALTCPQPEAARFIDGLKKMDEKKREMVKEVEESLQFEKQQK